MGIKTVKNGLKIVEEIVDDFFFILDKILIRKYTIDEFNDVFSENLDKLIIKISEKEKIKFIGGKFFIDLTRQEEKEMILVKYDFYFKNKEEKWIQKSNQKKLDMEYLDEEAIKEIRKGEKSYNIESPI